MIVTRSVGLTLLIRSTVTFLSGFVLEALLLSKGLWTRLPVGVFLVMILTLVSWCIWTALEVKANFSLLTSVYALKGRLVDFTRGARGKTSEPGSGGGDDDGQGRTTPLSRSATFKEALTRFRPRRSGVSSPTLVNGRVPSVEMGKIESEESV